MRQEPRRDLAKDENRERQSRYCQGFDPDWFMPAIVGPKWRSPWYPLNATRESVEQWRAFVNQMCIEALGPLAMPERAAEWETACQHDLELIRQHAPELLETKGQDTATPPLVKSKRSTERGEAQMKILAALTAHHQYSNGGCLNYEAVGNNELARKAGVEKSSVSLFFKKKFKGYGKYRAACINQSDLAAGLKLLNQEFAPHHLFARPPGEGRREDK